MVKKKQPTYLDGIKRFLKRFNSLAKQAKPKDNSTKTKEETNVQERRKGDGIQGESEDKKGDGGG